MKNFIRFLFIITLVITLSASIFAVKVVVVEVESDITLEEIEENIAFYRSEKESNLKSIENLRGFLYSEYLKYKEEYEFNTAMLNYYEKKLQEYQISLELKWQEKSTQYPVATKIWRYLTEELGYNEYVSAGIIGNMMVESGGHTLAIDPYNWDDATGRSFYGICQWGGHFPKVKNQDLDFQLDYLRDTIEEEFRIGGYSLTKFLALTDAREAARIFCRAYERPDLAYEYPRLGCAEVAYNFFTS